MRVLLDGYWYVNGPPSGRMILREIVSTWHRIHPTDTLDIVVPARDINSCEDMGDQVQFLPSRLRLHPAINGLELPRIARRHGPYDLVLTQNFGSRTPNSAAIIYDVLFQTNPEWFSLKERAYFRLIPATARWARIVFTESETESARIQDGNPRLRDVRTIGLGIPTGLTAKARIEAVAGLTPGRFLLTVGRLNVRKNLARTIGAALASGQATPDRPLVIVGSPSGKASDRSSEIDDGIARKAVVFVGGVDDAALGWLYRNCAVMIFASLDEGYGLPPIEALRLGARVVVSDRPIFHETLGELPVFVDPLDEKSIADGLATALSDAFDLPEEPFIPGATPWATVVDRIRTPFAGRSDAA
jgi:glycosyltransferase involved in cell wall biosynthesis